MRPLPQYRSFPTHSALLQFLGASVCQSRIRLTRSPSDVPGLAKDGGKNAKVPEGKDKKVAPVSTAEYRACGWRAWLNGTTVTLGMNNVFDLAPPFVAGVVAGAGENGYDEQTANIKGRTWYAALKKRF